MRIALIYLSFCILLINHKQPETKIPFSSQGLTTAPKISPSKKEDLRPKLTIIPFGKLAYYHSYYYIFVYNK